MYHDRHGDLTVGVSVVRPDGHSCGGLPDGEDDNLWPCNSPQAMYQVQGRDVTLRACVEHLPTAVRIATVSYLTRLITDLNFGHGDFDGD